MINSTQKNRIIKFFPPLMRRETFTDEGLLLEIPKYLTKFQFLDACRFEPFAIDLANEIFKPEMNKNQVIKNMLDDLPKELR